ncbi:MAG: hypothetical protein IT249_13320 [Chitinophagaceae bacterium]|nr:hypothetical protein [Chitinophagaceae bacterium]
MNSFNHYAFGAVCEWMFQNMAGIQPAEAGFSNFIIKPEIALSGVGFVNASYHAIHGEIKSSWKKEHGKLILRVCIPVNTKAEVVLPASSVKNILVDGKPMNEFTHESIEQKNNAISVKLGSGNYNIMINE